MSDFGTNVLLFTQSAEQIQISKPLFADFTTKYHAYPVACQAGVECDLRARFLAFRPAEACPEVTLHLLPSRFAKQPDRHAK